MSDQERSLTPDEVKVFEKWVLDKITKDDLIATIDRLRSQIDEQIDTMRAMREVIGMKDMEIERLKGFFPACFTNHVKPEPPKVG